MTPITHTRACRWCHAPTTRAVFVGMTLAQLRIGDVDQLSKVNPRFKRNEVAVVIEHYSVLRVNDYRCSITIRSALRTVDAVP